MTRLPVRALGVPLLWAILLGGALGACADTEYVGYRFPLQRCPGDGFALPDSIGQGGSRLSPQRRLGSDVPACPAYRIYALFERTARSARGARLSPLYARLERGSSCSLHVIAPFVPGLASDPVREVELVARLVLAQSSVPAPPIAAARREVVGTSDDLRTWCAAAR